MPKGDLAPTNARWLRFAEFHEGAVPIIDPICNYAEPVFH